MRIIHTMPLLVRGEQRHEDVTMAAACLGSLGTSSESFVVIHNQGTLGNEELRSLASDLRIQAVILGEGENVGICRARQRCFEYVWQHHPDVPYVSEVHVDMVLPAGWYEPLVEFLDHSDEPMISPGIVTAKGELHPTHKGTTVLEVPSEPTRILELLERIQAERGAGRLFEGLVHPVVHRSAALRQVGGYDARFLTGKQGYEDDSLLLGYSYYMGTRARWRPKCLLSSWVYHATLVQRMSLPGRSREWEQNLNGLARQYGAYGFKELARLHGEAGGAHFAAFFEDVVGEA